MEKRSRSSCTLECGLPEPASFGHSTNLSDGDYGGSFWRLSAFMIWSRQVCVGNFWTMWPDSGHRPCGGFRFLLFLFWDDTRNFVLGVKRVERLIL